MGFLSVITSDIFLSVLSIAAVACIALAVGYLYYKMLHQQNSIASADNAIGGLHRRVARLESHAVLRAGNLAGYRIEGEHAGDSDDDDDNGDDDDGDDDGAHGGAASGAADDNGVQIAAGDDSAAIVTSAGSHAPHQARPSRATMAARAVARRTVSAREETANN